MKSCAIKIEEFKLAAGPTIDRRRLVAASAAAGFAGPCLFGCSLDPGNAKGPKKDLTALDLAELGRGFRLVEFTPVDVFNASIDRIKRLDDAINAFTYLDAEGALAGAQKAAEEIAAGRQIGPLHGVPVAVKDNIDVAGMPTTAASKALSSDPAKADAESVKRLRDAGAVILGKLNMHELALGTTSATSKFGPVRNPWDQSRIAGGSSGGSAAAVAAGFCYAALGTDTGGSIRIPAAACGVVGMKPTHGLISLDGVVLISASYDHVGPICRTVEDVSIVLDALTDQSRRSPMNQNAVSAFRVGILTDLGKYCDGAEIAPDILAAFSVAVKTISRLVADVVPAEIPYPDLGPIIDLEGAPFHRTLDLTRLEAATRAGIEEELLLNDDDLGGLRENLVRFRAEFANSFREFDLVVAPTLPSPPIKIYAAGDPFAQAACTFAFSQAGAPAISVPCGFSRDGLPIGLMIGGPPRADEAVQALARAYETAAGWRGRRPPI